MIFIVWILLPTLLLLLLCIIIYSFIPSSNPRGLRIIMYHKVSEDRADQLTVRRESLKKQFEQLVEDGYTTVSFGDLLDNLCTGTELPQRSIIITLDDGYRDTYTLAFPLLVRYNLKATVFLVAGRINSVNDWDGTREPLMNADEIREMAASGLVEFGLHSYQHSDYRHLTPEEMREDISQSIAALMELKIPFEPVMCYPYGKFPRKGNAKKAMYKVFSEMGIRLATRIGGRINRLPVCMPYEIERIGIEGADGLAEFCTKLKKGRRKNFTNWLSGTEFI
jgi:peptidoglycan/xylan/chitin deacetylase (PgdA/CDA1 family)